jgi:hypothetical protein
MTKSAPDGEGGVTERFEYYMVRLARSAGQPERVAGLVERLGSGEKRSFDTGEELVRLVGDWSVLDLNMQPAATDRNAVLPETTGSPFDTGA